MERPINSLVVFWPKIWRQSKKIQRRQTLSAFLSALYFCSYQVYFYCFGCWKSECLNLGGRFFKSFEKKNGQWSVED